MRAAVLLSTMRALLLRTARILPTMATAVHVHGRTELPSPEFRAGRAGSTTALRLLWPRLLQAQSANYLASKRRLSDAGLSTPSAIRRRDLHLSRYGLRHNYGAAARPAATAATSAAILAIAVLAVCILGSSQNARAQIPGVQNKPEPKAELKPALSVKPEKTPLWNEINDAEYKAAVHVRYHHALANDYGFWDRVTKFGLLIAGIAGIGAPWIARFFSLSPRKIKGCEIQLKEEWIKWLVDFIGFVALVVSVWLLVYPYSDWRADHKVSYEKWNELKGKWDAVKRDFPGLTYEELSKEITKLEDEEHSVEASEPFTGDSEKLREFERLEKAYRIPRPATPPVGAKVPETQRA